MDNVSEDQRSDRRTRFDNSQQLAAVGGMLAVSGNHKGDQAQKQRNVTLALETQACHLANWCDYELEQCRDCQEVVTCSQQCIFTRRLAEVAIKEGITLHIELCVIAQLYICTIVYLCTCTFVQLHNCTGDHIMGDFGSKLPLSRFPHRSRCGGRSHGRDVDIPQLLESARILLLPVEVVELCIVQGCCLWWMWKLCKDIMDRRSMPRAANLMVARTCANANLECLDCKI